MYLVLLGLVTVPTIFAELVVGDVSALPRDTVNASHLPRSIFHAPPWEGVCVIGNIGKERRCPYGVLLFNEQAKVKDDKTASLASGGRCRGSRRNLESRRPCGSLARSRLPRLFS